MISVKLGAAAMSTVHQVPTSHWDPQDTGLTDTQAEAWMEAWARSPELYDAVALLDDVFRGKRDAAKRLGETLAQSLLDSGDGYEAAWEAMEDEL